MSENASAGADGADSDTGANFVIFHHGRCGSTVMQKLFRTTPGVMHEGEVFASLYGKRKEKMPNLTPRKFLRRRQRRAADKNRIYGCEIKYLSADQMEEIGITRARAPQFFARLGFTRFVLLTRENLLDRMISQYVAIKRGSYNRFAGDTSDTDPVRLPIDRLRMGNQDVSLVGALELLDQETRDMRACLQEKAPGFLELSYEADILADPNRGARRLADHIGLPYEDQEPPLTKVVTRSQRNQVENFDAVAAALQGTGFASMLETENEQEKQDD